MIEAGERVAGPGLVVVRLLGEGGMGEVYEAEHPELGRRFALKVLHRRLRDRPDLAARLRREALALGRVRHPNLVEVVDLGVTGDGRPYFVMELLAGRDLRAELSRRGPLPPLEALALLEQSLAGLGAAHAAGIVHRDVKPENLFLTDGGALKVLDFGVAKLCEGEGSSYRTAADAVVGTPRSMAPEQCARGPVDARADLYAAGLLLYELVAGRGPFDELRGQPDALRYAHCDRPPPPPSRFAPHPLPPEVERLILRALEKSPARRFQSAEAMAAEVRRVRASLAAVSTTTAPGAPPPPDGCTVDLGLTDAEDFNFIGRAPVLDALPGADLSVARLRPPRRLSGVRPPRRRPGFSPMPPRQPVALGLWALVLASLSLGLSLAGRLP